jgi:ABC-2 type transport system permease protein
MTRTFAFLILTSFRNRLVSMARRVKKPRYAIGMVLGLAYVFFFFIYPMTRGTSAGGMRTSMLQSDVVQAIAPVLLVLLLATTWFGGATLNALSFTQAEVSMLFPAPVSRRGLILYKLGTAQLPILFNAVILALVFGRGPAAIPRWLAIVSLWVTFSTLHLHRLGAALTHASTMEHGRAGFKRNWFAHVVTLLVLATIMGIFTLVPIEARGGANSPSSLIQQITGPLQQPFVQAVLYPFSIIVAPAFAKSVLEWAQAMVPALLLLALHVFWVLRSQAAFEEAAVEASAQRQQVLDAWRKRGTVAKPRTVKGQGRELGLKPVGNPAIAIIWKNTLCFFRTVRPMQLMATMLMPAIVGAYFGFKANAGATAIAGIAAMFAFVLLLAGGASIRNDLRSDMLNLAQLKALPLRGREIVLAEILSSALPLAIMQLVLLDIAIVSLQLGRQAIDQSVTTSIALSLPFAISALNLVGSTLRNGSAVLFPGWIRLGAEGAGGFEIIGQQMLSMLAMLLSFIVLMIVPAAVTLFIVMYVQPPAAVSIIFSVIVGSAALAAECYGLIAWLGRAFERAEPSQSA